MNNRNGVARHWNAWVVSWMALSGGCIAHTVQSAPIEIKPIHITMDINLRVQGELDEFFDFEEPADADNPASTAGSKKETK